MTPRFSDRGKKNGNAPPTAPQKHVKTIQTVQLKPIFVRNVCSKEPNLTKFNQIETRKRIESLKN